MSLPASAPPVVGAAPRRTSAHRVAIVTPHPIVALGLRTMLAPAGEHVRIVEPTPDLDPDAVLYDVVGLVDGDTAELDHWVTGTSARVLALTRALRPDLGALALDRGAHALVPLSESREDVLRLVLAALDGSPDDAEPAAESGLSPREDEVLRLVVRGLSNQQIADELFLSINSVKTYIRSAYRKIGVSTRSQVVAWCLRQGFAPGASTVGSRDAHDRLQGFS